MYPYIYIYTSKPSFQNSLKYSLKKIIGIIAKRFLFPCIMTNELLSEPPTVPHWKTGIPALSKYRQGLQGHHFTVSEINRTGSESETTTTLNGKVGKQMLHSWNIREHKNTFTELTYKKQRKETKIISHNLNVVLERGQNE